MATDPAQHLDGQDPEARFEAEFEHLLEAVVAGHDQPGAIRPYLFRHTIAFAAFDHQCQLQWRNDSFESWLDIGCVDLELCRKASVEKQPATVLMKDTLERPVLVIYAPAAQAQRWAGIDRTLAQYTRNSDHVAVAALSLSHMGDEIERAARAMGLSNLEARIAGALFALGSIKKAAVHAKVTYHTARKALSNAMKVTGLTRQTSLIQKLSQLATVTSPPRDAVENILIDVYNLTRRDAKLVHLLCEGYSRSDAADIAGLSAAVAKDRFAHIFETLDITSATNLPPLVMSAFGAAALLHEAEPIVRSPHVRRAPLRLIQGPDARMIAVNDYGPKEGSPVLIVHSSLSTRHQFRTVIEALQSNGFRPFTIDRPGFGLTDPAEESPDRFATGTHDVAVVCDQLGFEKIDVLTRGGAFHALALARDLKDRIGKVIVINPDLLQHDCSKRKGQLGMVRFAFDRYPDSIAKVAAWIASSLSKTRIETIIRFGVGDAQSDIESFSDTRNLDDFARSIMAFSTGQLSGFIREQRGYVLQTAVAGVEDGSNWRILLGDDDPIHDVAEMKSYWSRTVPGAEFQDVPGAGRFISLSHTQNVIDILKN